MHSPSFLPPQQGSLSGKLHLSGSQLCLATSSTRPIAAVGSDGGVVRIIRVTDPEAPSVLCRVKVHTSPVTHVLFNADTTKLMAVTKDQNLFFFSLGESDAVTVHLLGWVALKDGVKDIACPRSGVDDFDNVLIALPGSGVMVLHPPKAEAANENYEFTKVRRAPLRKREPF